MARRTRSFIIFGIFLITAFVFTLNIISRYAWRLPVLMYHSIDYTDKVNDKITISPEAFARQMRYLHQGRYNVIPLSKAVWYIKNKMRPPARTVAITFDDGYENNYKYAYPVLKQYRIPATIFVVTGLVGKEGFMGWPQIKEISDSGIIDIGSHTASHSWLTGLDDGSLKAELEDSKRILESHIGKPVDFLCYPMGGFNEHIKEAARAAGYVAAFATKPTKIKALYDIYEIKRVRISPTANNMFVFYLKLSGYHAIFRIIQNDYKEIPSLLWKKIS